MKISLPDPLKAFVEEQVLQQGYGTSSEYIRDVIRREQERVQFRDLVLEGAAAPRTGRAGAAYFDVLRIRVKDGEARG